MILWGRVIRQNAPCLFRKFGVETGKHDGALWQTGDQLHEARGRPARTGRSDHQNRCFGRIFGPARREAIEGEGAQRFRVGLPFLDRRKVIRHDRKKGLRSLPVSRGVTCVERTDGVDPDALALHFVKE